MALHHDRPRVVLNRQWTRNGFDVFVIVDGPDGNPSHVAAPLLMEPTGESARTTPPTFFLDHRAAQSLMNELYSAGFRPDDARHVNDALAANKEHIADLRRVAFSLLDCVTADQDETPGDAKPGGIVGPKY
jgi:hypothetical protein